MSYGITAPQHDLVHLRLCHEDICIKGINCQRNFVEQTVSALKPKMHAISVCLTFLLPERHHMNQDKFCRTVLNGAGYRRRYRARKRENEKVITRKVLEQKQQLMYKSMQFLPKYGIFRQYFQKIACLKSIHIKTGKETKEKNQRREKHQNTSERFSIFTF